MRDLPVACHKGPDRWSVQDLQESHVQPLQEDLRQVSGDMLHVAYGGKDSDAATAALYPQIMLDL